MLAKNKDYKLSLKGEYFVCCLIALIPKIIMIWTASYPLNITGDELFLFYIPAKLAGLDWSSCMYDYRYYGYGFSIFLVPLFKYVHNPVVLYRITLILVAIVQLVIPIICCYMLNSFLCVSKSLYVILITTICTYGVSMYPTYMYNEHIYIIWVWVSFFILAKLWTLNEEEKRKKALYSILLGFSFVGALTVHQRAVTLILAFFFLYIFILLACKKRFCYALPVATVYYIGNLINSKIMNYFIKLLKYGTVSGLDTQSEAELSSIQNTSVQMSFSLKSFLNKEYVQAVIRVFAGNINNWNIFTVGIGIFSIILGISFLIKLFKQEIREEEKRVLFFGVFGVISILITIAGLANTWGWAIKDAYVNNDATADALRGLTYTRYLIAYFPPVMMAVLAYICNHADIYIKLFHYTILFSGTFLFYYLGRIIPLMMNQKVGFGSLNVYSPAGYRQEGVFPVDYLFAILIFMFILFELYNILKKERIAVYLSILCILVLWRCTYSVYLGSGKNNSINYHYVDKTQIIIEQLGQEEINVPIFVYPWSLKETSQGYLFELQFVSNETKFYRGLPEDDFKEAIYLTIYPNTGKELLEKGYTLIQLDDEEYVYVKGDRIIQFIQNCLDE